MVIPGSFMFLVFLSTPSARRATVILPVALPIVHISIHALREEGDIVLYARRGRTAGFLSTPSARRATGSPAACCCP